MAGHGIWHENGLPLFFLVYRKVVRVDVAFQTTGEALVQAFAVRLPVTTLTGRNFSMRGMTCRALERRVSGHIGLQIIEDRIVAGTAGLVGNILGILLDVRSAMRGMTKEAVLELLIFHVRFMTVQAIGNGSVYLGMAALAIELGIVFAWKFCKFISLALVADCTNNHTFLAFHFFFQFGELDYFGRMRLLMAIHARNEILAVGKVVAIPALRHNIVPIAFPRVIGMKLLVAGGAVKLMLAAFVLEPFELIVMTPAALHWGKRLDLHCVYR